jgi:RNA recognition motif-containing protein
MATKTLFVGNLSYSATESDLVQTFSAYGGNNARIIEGRGFGFIDIDADKLDSAIADKNNSELGGRTLNVNEARPKGEGGGGNRSGGGGGGGGYGGGGRSRGSGW